MAKSPLVTSEQKEKKILHAKGLLDPKLRSLSEEDLQLINEAGGKLQEQFGQMLMYLLAVLKDVFTVTINYAQTLVEMIAAGNYDDDIDPNITAEHFPYQGTGEQVKKLFLVRFNKRMTMKEVKSELEKRNWRGATLPELLAFGAKGWNGKGTVVAVGTSWLDDSGLSHSLYVPAIFETCSGRRALGKSWESEDWSIYFCFLCAEK